jgi:hypothetical protein
VRFGCNSQQEIGVMMFSSQPCCFWNRSIFSVKDGVTTMRRSRTVTRLPINRTTFQSRDVFTWVAKWWRSAGDIEDDGIGVKNAALEVAILRLCLGFLQVGGLT